MAQEGDVGLTPSSMDARPAHSGVSERFSNPFEPLHLSHEDAAELEALAQAFVAQSVATYERFVLDNNSRVDESRWRFMYEKESVRSYAERSDTPSSLFSAISNTTSPASSSRGKRATMHADSNASPLPVILVVGSIVGSLDDTIYGFLCPTVDQVRVKTAYIQDGVVRASVLASLVQPTAAEPFRSLTVKWVERSQPLHVRAVMKNRDFVYMESTGVEYLRDGQRVGFQLVHSVQFPETPARASATRGNMSMCAVYRQKDSHTTDVFVKGFLNPAGGIVRSIITHAIAKALLSISKNVYCSRMKKLVWALHQRHQAGGYLRDAEAVAMDEPCVGCGKKSSTTSSLLAAAADRVAPSGNHIYRRRRCKLCSRYVCSDCRRLHKLVFFLPDRRLVQHQIAFCAACEQRTLAIEASDMARQELSNGPSSLDAWSDAYAHSSSSDLAEMHDLN